MADYEYTSGTQEAERNEPASVAKAAPTIDIDPTTKPAICIDILHCPYAVNILSSAPQQCLVFGTYGPDNAATI